MGLSKTTATIGIAICTLTAFGLAVGYRNRARINRLRKQGVIVPEGWSWWFGHLLVLDKKLKKLPPDVNIYTAFYDLVEKYEDRGYFLLDLWPVYEPTLMIFGTDLSHQVMAKHDLPKPSHQEQDFRPIIGGPSLITMHKEPWKYWRSLLSPGFSPSHMLSLVPSIVDSVEVFCQLLEEKVGREVFSLDDMTTRLAMDVITSTTLDTKLENQRKEHEFSHALNTIIHWHSFWDPRILLNPLRIPIQWYYGRIMSSFIRRELNDRFEEMKRENVELIGNNSKKAKSVIALALEEYIAHERETKKIDFRSLQLDEGFARIAANTIRLFIFAGNDTTAATIVYIYHALFKHPEVMTKMRAEHDAIFGPSSDAGAMLRQQPALLNQCKYTLSVIKETLRIYPPAGSMREGTAGISLVDKQGTIIPFEHLSATTMHAHTHVDPQIWKRPQEFLPERWLVGPDHELYPPPAGAYRPFELGPRHCIGQTLVLNEIRVIMAMTARRFNIEPAYEEWDAIRLAQEGLYSKLLRGLGLRSEVCKEVLGERAYQTSRSGAHPASGYPCRVSLLEKKAVL